MFINSMKHKKKTINFFSYIRLNVLKLDWAKYEST